MDEGWGSSPHGELWDGDNQPLKSWGGEDLQPFSMNNIPPLYHWPIPCVQPPSPTLTLTSTSKSLHSKKVQENKCNFPWLIIVELLWPRPKHFSVAAAYCLANSATSCQCKDKNSFGCKWLWGHSPFVSLEEPNELTFVSRNFHALEDILALIQFYNIVFHCSIPTIGKESRTSSLLLPCFIKSIFKNPAH